jgi:hypothetical protein
MTGNIAPRNFREQAKSKPLWRAAQNAAASARASGMQIICTYRLPAKAGGRRVAHV